MKLLHLRDLELCQLVNKLSQNIQSNQNRSVEQKVDQNRLP